jgi:hypothetical protein
LHKQSVTAVAIDDAGRMLDEKTVPAGSDDLVMRSSYIRCSTSAASAANARRQPKLSNQAAFGWP